MQLPGSKRTNLLMFIDSAPKYNIKMMNWADNIPPSNEKLTWIF